MSQIVPETFTDPLIEKGNGAIQNGGTMRARKAPVKKVKLSDLHKPVQIKQPAAGRWKCDSCNTYGKGGEALLRHSAKSNHRVFSPLD